MQSVTRDNFGPLVAYLVPGLTVLVGRPRAQEPGGEILRAEHLVHLEPRHDEREPLEGRVARNARHAAVELLVSRGADLNAKDNQGKTVIDSALGKAGGNSRGGQRIDVHEDTAALLRKLMGSK